MDIKPFLDGFSDSYVFSVLHKIRKLEHREVKLSVYSHTADKWQSQGLNLSDSTSCPFNDYVIKQDWQTMSHWHSSTYHLFL